MKKKLIIEDGVLIECVNKKVAFIEIPDGVTKIGKEAFKGCYNLTGITMPDSVAAIDDFAFYNCQSLTNVRMSNNITAICEGDFFMSNSSNDKYLDGTLKAVDFWGKLPPLAFMGVEDGDVDCIGKASISGSVRYAFSRYGKDIAISEDDFFSKYDQLSTYTEVLDFLSKYFELRSTGIERLNDAIASGRKFK